MLKKVITTAVLGASALATLATHAALPGFYIEGQGGYFANDIKKDIKGAMKDTGIDQSDIDDLMNKKFKSGSFGGKLSAGYQFDQNFALEAGYLMLPKVNGSFGVRVITKEGKSEVPGPYKGKRAVVSTSVFDVAGKAMFPVADGINVFGKLGVALVKLDGDIQDEKDKKAVTTHKLVDGKSWGPEFSAGLSFDITPNVVTSLSATYILPLTKVKYGPFSTDPNKTGTVKKRPSGMGFLSLGLAYNVG